MMKKMLLLCLIGFITIWAFGQNKTSLTNPIVLTGSLVKTTKSLKTFNELDEIPFVKVRNREGIVGMEEESEMGERKPHHKLPKGTVVDPALQKTYNSKHGIERSQAIVQNFDGLADVGASPADPTLCVGPNHIIQMVNGVSGSMLQIFDKAGTILVPAKNLDAITGNGGVGDPIALYDQLADRFVLTEFVNNFETGSEGLSIAVSQTSDPTGSWFVYFFSTGTVFPDYPKFSVWNDAYYATSHDFANKTQFIGCSVYAFDRAKMLAGNPTATVQKFLIGGGGAEKELSMCPVLLQGTTLPPAGSGGLIAYMNDGIWSGSVTDSIGLFEFKVNFSNPALSTLTTHSSMAVSSYVPFVGFNFGFAVTQPGSVLTMDVIQQRLMNQPIYRNFGDHEGIVMTHVVDQGSQIAGVRWYELQKTTAKWSVKNQSTFGPDNTFRWTPAICYDAAGNIALAYNVSSAINNVFPGSRYTGRRACDPANTMTIPETDIVVGTSSNGSNRWGDYNHMVCDPDGVRMWFTSAYNSSILWSTRISAITIDNCLPALCGDPTNLNSSAITGSSATVAWTAVVNAVSYDVDYQLAGTTTWTNAVTNTPNTQITITGLGANLAWNWRVRANCAAGSGNYVTAQFTTLLPCAAATDLFSFDVLSNSVSVSWIPGGFSDISYAVEYKLNSSPTWISAGTTGSTFLNIVGLTPNSLYDWRVQTTCGNGVSAFAAAQFTTITAQVCPSIYDNGANGNINRAVTIPLDTDIKGLINPRDDDDFYKFEIPSTNNVAITLKSLPANYDMRLYNSNKSQIAISEKRGKNEELINRRLTRGTYYIKVYGKDGAFNASNCYTLKVNTGVAANAPEFFAKDQVIVFPNPTEKTLNVSIKGTVTYADISVYNVEGKLLIKFRATQSNSTIDVSHLNTGLYFIRVNDLAGNQLYQSKFVKQ